MSKIKKDRLLKIQKVIDLTGLGRTTIYARLKAESFPKPVRLSARAIRFSENSIQEWIEEQKQNSEV